MVVMSCKRLKTPYLCPFAVLPSFGFSSPFAFSAGLELSFLVSLSFEGVLPVK